MVTVSERYLPDGWPLPEVNDANRAFFTSGRLVLQRCDACKRVQHPPMEVCHRCQSFSFTYEAAAGTGTIANVTIVHHAADPRLRALVPYNVVLVEPTDHPDVLVVGNVIGATNDQVTVGAVVRCTCVTVVDPDTGDTLTLPQWELVR
jgi:uncharacterized protein